MGRERLKECVFFGPALIVFRRLLHATLIEIRKFCSNLWCHFFSHINENDTVATTSMKMSCILQRLDEAEDGHGSKRTA